MLRLRKPSPAMAVACISLFIGLSGVSTAAVVVLKKNSVLSKHIKNGQVKKPDVGANAIDSSKVGDGTLLAGDFAAGQIPAGPRGDKGDAGPTGQIQGAAAGGDLTGTYPDPTIANGAVTAAKLAPPGAFVDAGLFAASPFCNPGAPNAWHALSPTVNNAVSYYRDPFGVVHLRGIALSCGTAPNPIFTLPAGYRPGGQEIQPAAHVSGAAKQVNIDSGGTVNAWALPATDEWLSLDGITFRCAPSGSNGCP